MENMWLFRSWGFVVTGQLVGPENRFLLRSLPIAAALKAVSPKAVGDWAIKLSDRGKRGGSACLGFAFQTIVDYLCACPLPRYRKYSVEDERIARAERVLRLTFDFHDVWAGIPARVTTRVVYRNRCTTTRWRIAAGAVYDKRMMADDVAGVALPW
jgi:hypothetical protein